jgi:hypothetical protein
MDIPSKDIKVNLITHSPQATMQRAAATTPDYFRQEVAGRLTLGAYPATFRGEGGRTRVEVYTGILLSEISYAGQDTGRAAAVERRVALFDTTWQAVDRMKGDLAFSEGVTANAGAGAYLLGVRAFEAPPGDYHLAVQVTDRTSHRTQAYRERLRVGRYGTDSLQVSDLVLAARITPETRPDPFVKNGLLVLPMPLRTFGLNQSLFLYCEVYNLMPDAAGLTRYRVDYTIRSKEARPGGNIFAALGKMIRKEQKKGEVTVSYEFTGIRPDPPLHVEIKAQEAGPGDHVLRVAVTDLNSGAKAARETTFWVQK